ncbi:CvpA family protein [Staphylococcus sp. IVB6246]|uniref:CvpA family protein n=1 Tax=Staphylococcus sp. IVB6246 TaxID=2989772 RepID=UPI0021D3B996|nr:CvpA family protein [Staphylococcus sp. IVB6246]UXR70241.1 CvpA family protein [Staphylococcus sp. IVB6246]
MYLLFVCIVLLLFMMTGFHRGLIGSLLHLSSTLFGLWVAMQYYQPFSDYLRLFLPFPKTLAYDAHYVLSLNQPGVRFDRVCGFIIIVLIVKTMMYMVFSSVSRIFGSRHRSLILRILGIGTGLVSGVIFLHFVSYIAVLIPYPHLQTHIAETQLGQWFVLKVPLLSEMTLHL